MHKEPSLSDMRDAAISLDAHNASPRRDRLWFDSLRNWVLVILGWGTVLYFAFTSSFYSWLGISLSQFSGFDPTSAIRLAVGVIFLLLVGVGLVIALVGAVALPVTMFSVVITSLVYIVRARFRPSRFRQLWASDLRNGLLDIQRNERRLLIWWHRAKSRKSTIAFVYTISFVVSSLTFLLLRDKADTASTLTRVMLSPAIAAVFYIPALWALRFRRNWHIPIVVICAMAFSVAAVDMFGGLTARQLRDTGTLNYFATTAGLEIKPVKVTAVSEEALGQAINSRLSRSQRLLLLSDQEQTYVLFDCKSHAILRIPNSLIVLDYSPIRESNDCG